MRHITFKKQWMVHAIIALLTTIFLLLANWQWQRAQFKQQWQQTLKVRQQSEPILLTTIADKSFEKLRFQRVAIEGQALNEFNIFLDQQTFNHLVGYRVLTPVLLNNQHIVLVDRGWIEQGDRALLPSIKPIQANKIVGIINQPSQGIKLKDEMPPPGWPKRILNLDYQAVSQLLSNTVYPYIVSLEEAHLVQTHWVAPYIGISSNKHLAYAIQWLSMAIVTMLYYGLVYRRRHKHDTDGQVIQ